ncbi:MAG TPA: DEAD/DEAH box helicase, partial [Longimicrobium sp.]|nr:DEAD/DEAH box helicase [Longimicrobium sp.]
MASFNDLGLREPLVMALEEEGIEHPTALQEAAIPVLRREGNLVARAASGSGKTLAYGLGVLDRIEPRGGGDGEGEGEEAGAAAEEETAARVLVLVPTAEQAEHAALALVPYAHAAELTVAVSGPGWGTRAGDADVLVATPTQVLDAVRASGVKLHALEAVVVDGASEIESLGGWEAVEALFDNVPREAQRVVLSAELTPGVQDLVDRRVKRAIRYPSQPALADQAEAVEVTGVVGYIAVSEREKVDVLARLLGGERDGDAPPLLVCRTDERAAQVAEALSLRGFLVGDAGDEEADVLIVGSDEGVGEAAGEGGGHYGGTVISFDVPPDDRTLKLRHGGETTGFVLARPRELAHLRETAARAGLEARPAGISGETSPKADELRAFRDQLRRAVAEEDLGAQILVLEPLFDEFTPAEVAAAAAALLRRRPPVAQASSEIG